jgi:mono/diheme cytochrome c family protein
VPGPPTPDQPPRRRRGSASPYGLRARARFVLPGVALGLGLLIAGCGGSGSPDVDRGRNLFIANCGTCHTLAQAGTSANIGPNLDAAFAQARADGMDSDTVEGVVSKQIAHPRIPNVPQDSPLYTKVYMPPELVTGQDAQDVAAYVGGVAGVPGAKPPPLGAPPQIFTAKCAVCHTLEPGAPAGTGPNLADALKGEDADFVHEQIVNPNSDIAQGFQPNIMPQDFEQQLDGKVDGLVDYILSQVNGGGK